jgi:hypothetical protein
MGPKFEHELAAVGTGALAVAVDPAVVLAA